MATKKTKYVIKVTFFNTLTNEKENKHYYYATTVGGQNCYVNQSRKFEAKTYTDLAKAEKDLKKVNRQSMHNIIAEVVAY